MAIGLGEWALRAALTSSRLEAGLARRGRELPTGGGYRRCPLEIWDQNGATARATARFGPFATPVVFDALLVLDGDDIVTSIAKGVTQLPQGDYSADIILGMVDS